MRNIPLFLLWIFIVCLSGCSSVRMATTEQDKSAKEFSTLPDQGTVFIFRNGATGSSRGHLVSMNGTTLGETAAHTYFRLNLNPGKYRIDSHSQRNHSTIDLEVESGRNYFVWQEITRGDEYVTRLQTVNETEGRKGVLESKLIAFSIPEDQLSAAISRTGNRPPEPPAADPFLVATKAFDERNYAMAAKLFRPLADQGNTVAQSKLGWLYNFGQGVARDYKEAEKLYRLAADKGDASAQMNLGEMYYYGLGVPQDYKEAIKWYRLAADQGVASAQFDIGFMYDNRQGVFQDYKEAEKWYRLAAVQGNVLAQWSLGAMYYDGKGVPQDYVEAMKWFQPAADQGIGVAQARLALMNYEGQAVPQNYRLAEKWYRLAAEQGVAFAQFNLGLMYKNGEGVSQDYKEAEKWFRLLAERGDVLGQIYLADMYMHGQGMPQNYVLSYMWFDIAANSPGSESQQIAEYRDSLSKNMTAQQIAEAHKLTRICSTNKLKGC
jgi:TPR repeat protein